MFTGLGATETAPSALFAGSHDRRAGVVGLPAARSSSIGRAALRAELHAMQAPAPSQEQISARLLTLIGVGGCGKTRLALEVAGELVEHYRDGVWLVDLAGLSDAALVPLAVMARLGLDTPHGQQVHAAAAEAFGSRSSLLLLDNCEHLRAGCALLVAALLVECPGVRVLATSRVPLGIVAEVARSVPPLMVPEAQPLLAPVGRRRLSAERRTPRNAGRAPRVSTALHRGRS
jgi:non-specific serine/threonine protein kinase